MAEIKLNKHHPLYLQDIERILSVDGIRSLRGKSFLITGATGLIGVCLIDALMTLGDVHVYAVGRNVGKAVSRLGEYYANPLFHFIEQDVRDAFPENLAVDYIIPLASNTHPLAYSQYPVETIEINVKGAEHALNLAVRCGAEVLYPSSVEIYGNARGEDYFTEDYTGQLNLSTSRACYTESKRLSEALCQSYVAEYGAKCKIARLSRVFGPTMLETDSKASSQFIKKALEKSDIVLKSKGLQFFSYTYVADAVSAMLHILLNGENGISYNVSSEKCNVRLYEFAEACAEISDTSVVFDLPTEAEVKGFSVATYAVLDNSRLRGLGWSSVYDLKDAVKRTIEIVSGE